MIPFWCIRLFFELLNIVILALAVGVVVEWRNDDDNRLTGSVDTAYKIIAPIYIGVIGVCLILTITEIILLARHKLKPLAFLIMNIVKTAIMTVLFVFQIISYIYRGTYRNSAIGLGVSTLLLLSFWIPLIYGSVIYHRFRKEKKLYSVVQDPLSTIPLDTAYPPVPYPQQPYNEPYESRYKCVAAGDLESNTGDVGALGRRASYNHERDNRFEAFRQDRSAYSSEQQPLNPSGNIPELHVEHHNGEAYEINSRRELR